MKRIYKYQIEKQLKEQEFDRIHTLCKMWHPVNGINRYGWFVATIYGWHALGATLQHSYDRLELRGEEMHYISGC